MAINYLTLYNCTKTVPSSSTGIFMGNNPMKFTLPLLSVELAIYTTISRTLDFLFKPLKVARISSDVITGVILGPSLLGRIAPDTMHNLFPESQKMLLSSLGSFASIYWFFLIGIQINFGSLVKRVDGKSMGLAVANLASSFLFARLATLAVNSVMPASMKCDVMPVTIGLYVGIPAVTVLASTVVQHKLLDTAFGKMAMTTAVSTQLLCVMVLDFFIMERVPGKPLLPLWGGLCGFGLTAVMFLISRLTVWYIRNEVNDFYITVVLLFVSIMAAVSDGLGLHLATGAFISGLVMPNGLLAATFVKRLEDFIALLIPIIVVMIGQEVRMDEMFQQSSCWTLVLILFITYVGKFFIVLLVTRFYNLTVREGCLTGVLLTSKGIIDAMLLKWAANAFVDPLSNSSLCILLIGIVVNNFLNSIFIKLLHRPSGHSDCREPSTRCIQQLRSDAPLCIIACIYDQHMLHTLISLLESTAATPKSPVKLLALHVIHTTTREATMMHGPTLCSTALADPESEEDPVHKALKGHRWKNENVVIHHFTRMSPYSTMHEDAHGLAVDKSAAMIIVPFRKDSSETADSGSKALRAVNESILACAPCSVGILLQKGLIKTSITPFQNVTVLFFGGPDDREALAYVTRMARYDGVMVSVVRFLHVPSSARTPSNRHSQSQSKNGLHNIAFLPENDREKVVDDYCIGLFQMEMAGNKSVSYTEFFVSSGSETVDAIQAMNRMHDLFIVGRNHDKSTSMMLAGMEDWNEYRELGPIGDFLASPDFSEVSVFVIQQHVWRKSLFDKDSSSQEDRRLFLGDGVKQSPSPARSSFAVGSKHKDTGFHWDMKSGF